MPVSYTAAWLPPWGRHVLMNWQNRQQRLQSRSQRGSSWGLEETLGCSWLGEGHSNFQSPFTLKNLSGI